MLFAYTYLRWRNDAKDIPLLAQYFLDNVAKELGDEPKRLDADTADYLVALPGGQRAAVRKYLPLVTSDGQLKTILVEDHAELRDGEESSGGSGGRAVWLDGRISFLSKPRRRHCLILRYQSLNAL